MKLQLLAAISALFFTVGYSSYAQTRIETRLLIVDNNNIGVSVYFGLDTAATDGINSALGESEFFPSHPPSGMHAAIQFPPPGNEWCYRDYRKLVQGQYITKEFRIEVQSAPLRDNSPINFNWDFPLAKGIDSIVIVDRKTNGVRAKFYLDFKRKFVVSDDQSDSFIARAYYHIDAVGVEEDVASADHAELSPNPATDVLAVSTIKDYEHVEIISVDGRVYIPELNGNSISIQNMPTGVYAVIAAGINGKRSLGTFVKQ